MNLEEYLFYPQIIKPNAGSVVDFWTYATPRADINSKIFSKKTFCSEKKKKKNIRPQYAVINAAWDYGLKKKFSDLTDIVA